MRYTSTSNTCVQVWACRQRVFVRRAAGTALTEPLQVHLLLWRGETQAGLPGLPLLSAGQAAATRRGAVGQPSARLSPEPWLGAKATLLCSQRTRPGAGRFGPSPTRAANSACRTRTSGKALGDALPTCHNHCHARSEALSEAHARNRSSGHRREPDPPSRPRHRLIASWKQDSHPRLIPPPPSANSSELVSHVHIDQLHLTLCFERC